MATTPDNAASTSAGPAPADVSSARRGPRRTCIGCRKVTSPDELIRLTRSADGGLRVGGHPGRGAWLCPDRGCLDAARKRRAFGRALRHPVRDEAIEALGVANLA